MAEIELSALFCQYLNYTSSDKILERYVQTWLKWRNVTQTTVP